MESPYQTSGKVSIALVLLGLFLVHCSRSVPIQEEFPGTTVTSLDQILGNGRWIHSIAPITHNRVIAGTLVHPGTSSTLFIVTAAEDQIEPVVIDGERLTGAGITASPSGELVAFHDRDWTIMRLSPTPTIVTTSEKGGLVGAWHNDTTLTFPRLSEDKIIIEFVSEENVTIDERQVDAPENVVRVEAIAWSPDEQTAAMVLSLQEQIQEEIDCEGCPAPDEQQDVYLFDLSNGTLTRVTDTPDITEYSPTWSPDGNYLAFLRQESGMKERRMQFYRIDGANRCMVASSNPSNLLFREPFLLSATKVAWSLEGTTIMVNGGRELYAIPELSLGLNRDSSTCG